jgi:DNA-binding response OmpR family regulator
MPPAAGSGAMRERSPVNAGSVQSATILLIEDDLTVAGMLRDRLGARGHVVWHAASAAEAEAIAKEIVPDLIIVDLMLPDANGLVLCSEMRQRWEVPIIICTGSRRREDAVLGLRLGADDFIRKPFSTDELELRIEAALRRPSLQGRVAAKDDTVCAVGTLTIDRARCSVRVDDEPIHLTPTEYHLLRVLAEQPNRVVPISELTDQVWGTHDPDIVRSLQVHIRRMRAKLNAGQRRPPALVAVRGFGYQLVWDGQPTTGGTRGS